jgi:hypothetical protein
LADVRDAFIAEAGERMVNSLALGIEDGAFWHDPDVCFHAGSITFGTLVIEAASRRKASNFARNATREGGEDGFVLVDLFWREEEVVG